MLESNVANAFWIKFAAAPREWLVSKAGRELIEKAVALVRERAGDAEADYLANLVDVASALPI